MGIVKRFARVGGELVRVTGESTRAVAEVRHHAGITKVRRFSFWL